MGWQYTDDGIPAYRTLVRAVATLTRLGCPCDTPHLARYAQVAADVARTDLDPLEGFGDATWQVEAGVALTALYEPVLLGLRRLAQAEESARRFEAPSS